MFLSVFGSLLTIIAYFPIMYLIIFVYFISFLPTTLKTHICGFKAVDYASLDSDFKCDLCDKAYVTRSNLTDHVRRAHKGN